MSANSEQIVQQIRAELEAILLFVLNASPAQGQTADVVERSLWRCVLALGKSLLRLYFVRQDETCRPETVLDAAGEPLPYHSDKERPYRSVFGVVRFARRYYYRSEGGQFPLDAALNLTPSGCSDLVREWREQLAAFVPYHKADALLGNLLGQTFESRSLSEAVRTDALDVGAYYEKAQAPTPHPEASVLVVQSDGKGVPMVCETTAKPKARLGKGEKNTRKKEAVVCSVYTIEPAVRTPEAVVESLFQQPQETEPTLCVSRASPRNKWLWATLSGKEAALSFTARQVRQQDGPHIAHRVALTDGSEALQQRMQAQFADFTLVLDFIHANEYLWQAANALLGETAPQRTQWVQTRALQMLRGQTEALTVEFRQLAKEPRRTKSQQETLLRVAAYYERNQAFMHYDRYLAAGWPIATGVIEGACRHLVKDRCELSGMRWSQPGAEALLRLRCVEQNGDWEAFHTFRRAQRQSRLYASQDSNAQHVQLKMAA